MALAQKASPLKLVRDFFGLKLADMKSEWTTLPQEDKDDILSGLTPDENGVASLTY